MCVCSYSCASVHDDPLPHKSSAEVYDCYEHFNLQKDEDAAVYSDWLPPASECAYSSVRVRLRAM